MSDRFEVLDGIRSTMTKMPNPPKIGKYNQTNLRAVARELVEKTVPRPGRQFLLVDSEYVEQLADCVGATLGARAER